MVLVVTQLFNVVLVPRMAHAGLALSIGLGALVNASWLLWGLLKRGSYKPRAGWLLFGLQVLAASLLMAVFLLWANAHFDWLALRAHSGQRVLLLAGVLTGAALLYFTLLRVSGLGLRATLKR